MDKKKILVVGGGGREHAVIKALSKSDKVGKIYAAPGNGGISAEAECVDISATDIEKMVEFAKDKSIDLCVVTPDDPLVAGMVDAMQEAGIRAFGPNQKAAALEGSKVFSKELMKKYNIPTAAYEVFDNAEKAIEYIKEQNSYPTVIKADGLALGKGVIIAQNYDEAVDGVRSIMEDKVFGASGNKIVIEEFLTGPEVSVLSFCDSHTIIPMVSSMDHKRALDNDEGLNTGGMGTVAPNPCYTEDFKAECMEKIFIPTMEAMNKEGRPFKGVIFFGLMLTPKGARVIEYNCRFGDPETQVVLPLLESDLYEIFNAVIDEKLAETEVKFSEKSAACVIMASGGYPKNYAKGIKINGLDKDGQIENATVYHAGTKLDENGDYLTAGGRVLGVTCIDDTLEGALKKSYENVEKIDFKDAHYRKDIGKKALDFLGK